MNAFVKITSLKLIKQRKSMTDLQQRERTVLTLVTQIVNRAFKVLGGYFKKHSPSLPLPLCHYDSLLLPVITMTLEMALSDF